MHCFWQARLKRLNSYAPIVRCTNAEVALEHVFGIRAFELTRVLEHDPAFLSMTSDGAAHWHGQRECTDPACTEEHCGTCEPPNSNELSATDVTSRRHDSRVTSVGFLTPGELKMDRIHGWISSLLQERGQDIYRMKGVLAMRGSKNKYVYQGVHMMFKGEFTEPWDESEPRLNRLIFIGKNLDRDELSRSFDACRDAPAGSDEELAAAAKALREPSASCET